MGWQERERDIQEALKVIKSQQADIGMPGLRLHEDGMIDRVARMIVLERGDCRYCQSLDIEIKVVKRIEGKKGVSLKCRSGKSPLELHLPYVYELGKVPSCSSLVPFEQEE